LRAEVAGLHDRLDTLIAATHENTAAVGSIPAGSKEVNASFEIVAPDPVRAAFEVNDRLKAMQAEY
jgi:hypothetical protein